MAGFLKGKRIGYYLNIASCAVGIVALIVYLVYGAALGMYESAVIALFIAGIACGIVALTKKNKLTKGGAALSIIAIALPVVVCAVVILLFSTGVWVIRLM